MAFCTEKRKGHKFHIRLGCHNAYALCTPGKGNFTEPCSDCCLDGSGWERYSQYTIEHSLQEIIDFYEETYENQDKESEAPTEHDLRKRQKQLQDFENFITLDSSQSIEDIDIQEYLVEALEAVDEYRAGALDQRPLPEHPQISDITLSFLTNRLGAHFDLGTSQCPDNKSRANTPYLDGYSAADFSNQKANKGEWSELYVLLKLLNTDAIPAYHGHDRCETPLQSIVYNGKEDRIQFDIGTDNNIHIFKNDEEIASVSRNEIAYMTDYLYKFLNSPKEYGWTAGTSSQRAFPVPVEIEHFLINKLHLQSFKAPSRQKADIELKTESTLRGYSIKSNLGSLATLLNASGCTICHFLVDNLTEQQVNDFNDDSGWQKGKLSNIRECGGNICPAGFRSEVFQKSLNNINPLLPDAMAWAILEFQDDTTPHGKTVMLKDIVSAIAHDHADKATEEEYVRAFKDLLFASYAGLRPSEEWSQKSSSQVGGGLIQVQKDGSLKIFSEYQKQLLIDELYNQAKLDTPSSSKATSEKNEWGQIRRMFDNDVLTINFQIRLKH